MASAWASECPKLLPKLLERISPPDNSGRVLPSGAATPFRARARASQLAAVDWASFLDRLASGYSDRIFIIFTPSGAEARVATGHMSLFVKQTWFNRVPDEAGSLAMVSQQRSLPELILWSWTSPPPSHVFGLLAGNTPPYLVVHELQVTPAESELLHRFFHDRVWFHHAGEPSYRRPYDPLPWSRPQSDRGENCVTFGFSFLDPSWHFHSPQIADLAQSFGPLEVNELPIRQAQLLLEHPRRMGSYWVNLSDNPEPPAMDQFRDLIR
jgi:hypothetical protein